MGESLISLPEKINVIMRKREDYAHCSRLKIRILKRQPIVNNHLWTLVLKKHIKQLM